MVAGFGTLAAGIVATPALIAGFSPVFQPRRHSVWRPIGPLSDFPVGEVRQGLIAVDRQTWPRSYGRQPVFVWRSSESEIVVLSRSCTDLGCPVGYDEGSGCFLCPCHGGIFDRGGARLAGPPKGPMFRYAHRVRDDVLEVDISSVPPNA